MKEWVGVDSVADMGCRGRVEGENTHTRVWGGGRGGVWTGCCAAEAGSSSSRRVAGRHAAGAAELRPGAQTTYVPSSTAP